MKYTDADAREGDAEECTADHAVHSHYPAGCFYALAHENPEAAGAVIIKLHLGLAVLS